MDKLKNYVEEKFQNFPVTEESSDIKADILASVEDKYRDLIESGKTDEEAFEVISGQFGDVDELKEALFIPKSFYENLYNVSSFFQKASHTCLLILATTLLLFFIFWFGFASGFFIIMYLLTFIAVFSTIKVLMHPKHFDDDLPGYHTTDKCTFQLFYSLFTTLLLFGGIFVQVSIIDPWIYSRAIQITPIISNSLHLFSTLLILTILFSTMVIVNEPFLKKFSQVYKNKKGLSR